MRLERSELTVGEETYEGRLNVPATAPERGVLLLGGAGHGPFGDIFDVVSYELAGDGRLVYRYESWDSLEELEGKTLGELQAEVGAAVAVLEERGCESITVIAKSFGGGIALSHVPDAVDRLVLWAPAVDVGVAAVEATDADERIGDGEGLLIGLPLLAHVTVPVRILRGTADEGVTREDCFDVLDRVEDGALTEIPGETHSFNECRPAIVDETRRALRS